MKNHLRIVTEAEAPVFTLTATTGPKGYPLFVAFWLLAHRTDQSGSCEATMLDVVAGTGLGRTTAQRAMSDLLAFGALERLGTGPRLACRYRWAPEVLAEWRKIVGRAGAPIAPAATENVYSQACSAETLRYDDEALAALICEAHLAARQRKYPQKRFLLDALERPQGPTILTRVRQLCDLHQDVEPPRVVAQIMRRYMALPASEKCLAKFHPLAWIVHSLGEIGAELSSALTRALPAMDELAPPAGETAELSRGLLAHLGGAR